MVLSSSSGGVTFLISNMIREPITDLPGSEHMIALQEFPHLARMAGQYLSGGLVKSDLRGRLLDTTLIDLMWAKQAP